MRFEASEQEKKPSTMEKSRLKDRISDILRSSLQSYCSVSSRNASDVAGETVFVSRRYDSQKLDPSIFFPSLSEDSSPNFSLRRLIGVDSTEKKKKERRVSEIGVCYEAGGAWDGRTCPPASPVSPSNRHSLKQGKEQKREKKTKKKLLSNSYGFTSSSSEDSDEKDGFFSSDEIVDREAETETLFSSRSFSSDSSEFYYHSTHHKKKKKKSRRSNRSSGRRPNSEGGFRPLVSIVSSATSKEEKGKGDGFAVVKQSSDPYEDFRSSMMEMIVEKRMLGAKDLERLLHCYLYLNSPRHHRVIVGVFSEICDVLFDN